MTEHHTYAKFWRCALQVNPFGYNETYRGAHHGMNEDEYNQALLRKCLELDIKVVGIADHGSVTSVNALRKVLEPAGIVVFPGFEIASNDKTHYVCLFSEDTTNQKLERYLGSLNLLDPLDGVHPSRLSSEDLIDKVNQLGGFIYAAHCTQDNGLLKNRLNHVWKTPKLRAVQIPKAVIDLKNKDNGFYYKVICNKEAAYLRERPIAVINAKDIANPEDLNHPSATCLIKMTRPNFAAFKVAFLDPESRIRLNSENTQNSIGKITSIAVDGGYLDGLKGEFSDHLNTVIGGRGTGKSTLLECIRYALDLSPKGKQARKLHDGIIKENLGKEVGRVELSVISSAQNGKQYKVSRRYGEPPIVRDSNGNVSNLLPKDLLPNIDVYGQNEIYELAQDEDSRVQLLSRFLPDDVTYEEKRLEVHKRLKENQLNLVRLFSDLDDFNEELNRLPKLQEQVRAYDELGIKEKLAMTSLLARECEIIKEADNCWESFEKKLDIFNKNLPDLSFINDQALKDLPDRVQLIAISKTLCTIKENIQNHIVCMKNTLSETSTQFKAQRELWREAIQQHKNNLEETMHSIPSTAGKTGKEIGADYQRLVSEIERIKPKKTELSALEAKLKDWMQQRSNLLADLSDIRSKRINALQTAAKRLNRQLQGKLEVQVIPDANRSPLIKFLLECKLEGIGEKRLAWISEVETITPLALVQSIRKGAKDIIENWSVMPMVAEALTKLQRSQLMELETLELEHRVVISLNVAHGQKEPIFRPLDKLSTGQQCTAILHMLLLENSDPLLMDQPEDNLDNAFIAERIVTELRSAKMTRQFLFATHNANIPVFGDAEWIGVFTVEENKGSLGVNAQGSIDVPEIREQVANILEGGREAFIQRKEKYEF